MQVGLLVKNNWNASAAKEISHNLGACYIDLKQFSKVLTRKYRTSYNFRITLLIEMGFHRVVQAGLEFLTSSDVPALASQSAVITAQRFLEGI
ncbi:uncharacterized protein LOC105723016 isoform X1 [Aotus nancymaae]|uniref:uncharacterized protein LOC105723016 isoform X1 n=1 Tax=Aotus nancymaae TaxID=37293 RepID=UPI0030FE66CF